MAGQTNNNRRSWRIDLPDLAATERFAQTLSGFGGAGDVIALKGPLGAGKTAFARAFIRARFGIEEVPSPTFNLVLTYDGAAAVSVWHFDLYRLDDPDDVFELGYDDALSDALSLIEWPERLGALLPTFRLMVSFVLDVGDQRSVILDAPMPWAERLAEVARRENWIGVEG